MVILYYPQSTELPRAVLREELVRKLLGEPSGEEVIWESVQIEDCCLTHWDPSDLVRADGAYYTIIPPEEGYEEPPY